MKKPPKRVLPLLAAIRAELMEGGATSEQIDAAIAVADPSETDWRTLAIGAIRNDHFDTVAKVWSILGEGWRKQVLANVFSFESAPASSAMKGHLVRLAGLPMLESMAVSIIDDDRDEGDEAYEEALTKIDALSELIGEPARWVAFCDRQSWERHLMPRTAAMRVAVAQRAAMSGPVARAARKARQRG